MEIVEFKQESCECAVRIQNFFARRQQSGFSSPGVGTVVTCDCGRTWVLTESPDTGRFWIEQVAGE